MLLLCGKISILTTFLGLLALETHAQTQIKVEPPAGEVVSLQFDPRTGERSPAFSVLTPKGRYTVRASYETSPGTKRSQVFTVDHPGPVPLAASAQPPVVLLNGLQLPDSLGDFLLGRVCPVSTGNPRSSGTFGNLETLLKSQGFQVVFFDNCAECPGGTIEDCGRALGRFLERYPREPGAAEDFDLVAHSMGGLIIRSWLAGKSGSGFAPPERTRIRRAVFLGTPHFGSYTAVSLPFLPPQVAQLAEGSSFVWSLNTWNQGADDMRGLDSLAVAGAGCPLGGLTEAGDGVVALTSASLSFVREPERTRVVPYRHTSTVLGPCPARAMLANIDNAEHLSYRAIVSFLTGTEEWRAIGLSSAEHPVLSRFGGGVLEWQDEQGNRVASSRLLSGAGVEWGRVEENRYETNLHPAETTDLWFETASGWVKNGAGIAPGGARPYLIKWGPWIGSVQQVGATLTLRGVNLSGLEVTIDGAPARVATSSADAIAVEWDGPAGLHKVEAAGPSGRATINWFKP